MTNTIPGTKSPRFYEKKWVVELIGGLFPIAAAAVTAYVNFTDPDTRKLGWALIVSIIWLIIASIIKVMHANAQDKEQRRKQGHDGLWAAIHVIWGTISTHLKFSEKDHDRVRVTIFRLAEPNTPSGECEEVEQLLPYVGGHGGEVGRRFSIRSGIVGKVIREGVPLISRRVNHNHEDFIREMVRDWAFTDGDARQLRTDRQSWMAVPIRGRHQTVVGAVFLDSSDQDFFGDQIQLLVILACTGITLYTKDRYQ